MPDPAVRTEYDKLRLTKDRNRNMVDIISDIVDTVRDNRTDHAENRLANRAISLKMLAIVLALGARKHTHGDVRYHFHDQKARGRLKTLLLAPPADLDQRTKNLLRDGVEGDGQPLPFAVISGYGESTVTRGDGKTIVIRGDGKTVITSGWQIDPIKTN